MRKSNPQEKVLLPSKVFGTRLRETRRARGLTQTDLARLMTEAGRPMNKAAVLRIENGERGLQLDEAVTFAQVLNFTFANFLEPARDGLVALTDRIAVDGDGVRRWLSTGQALSVWPAQLKTAEDRDLALAYMRELMVSLVIASSAKDEDEAEALTARIKSAAEKLAKGDDGDAE